MDGEQETSRRIMDALSCPDSVPTELMSLDRYGDNTNRYGDNTNRYGDNTNPISKSNTDVQSRRKGMLLIGIISLIVLLLSALNIYLVWDHRVLQQRHETLETQIDDLLKKVTEITETKQSTELLQLSAGDDNENHQDWDTESGNSSKFVLTDNCWFKAEFELGNCFNDVKECWSDFASQTIEAVHKIATFEYETDASILQAGAWNHIFSEATYSAAKAMTKLRDSMVSWGRTIDQSILYAMGEARDAIEDSSPHTYL